MIEGSNKRKQYGTLSQFENIDEVLCMSQCCNNIIKSTVYGNDMILQILHPITVKLIVKSHMC